MGGSEYQIKCLLESNLLQDFFEIYLLCRRSAATHKTDGYHIVQIAKPYALQRYAHFVDTPFLLNRLKQISPEVIYQNIGTSYAGIASYYARKTGCKMVLHIASDNNITPYEAKISVTSLIRFIEKKLFDYAIFNTSKLIAQTNNQMQTIKKYYNRSVDKVIYNFQPLPEETEDKQSPIKVVWVANFKHLKQPEIFIRLAKDISEELNDIEFVMAGRPSDDKKWQISLEKEISQIPKLRYLGEKTNGEINQLLSKSHIFVNTSQYEGFSNTFIQAWMRRVPVVSLNSNPDELLNSMQMGFSSKGNYEQLRNDVLNLIKNNSLRENMGKNALSYSVKNFSMENAKCIIAMLRSH